jgi:serine/threonine protein kinase
MNNTKEKSELGDSLLLNRYKVLKEIQPIELSSNRILQCLDTLNNTTVALKCVNASEMPHDMDQIIQKCRGIMIAEELQRMSHYFPKINEISFTKVPFYKGYAFVINMEYMDLNLTEVMAQKSLSYNNKISIFYHMVKALSELEDAGVAHTNLNPSHILLSKDLQTVKICGFNKAKQFSDVVDNHTLWNFKKDEGLYRPLEILVHAFSAYQKPQLSSSMDVWSLGCIFAQILRDGISLFSESQNSNLEDYRKIWFILGFPTTDESENGLKIKNHSTCPDRHANLLLQRLLPHDKNSLWVKMVDAILHYHPQNRITIKKLLNHECFIRHFEKLPKAQDRLTNETAKMERICIQFPAEIRSWKTMEFRSFFETLMDAKRSAVAEIQNFKAHGE